MWLVVFLQRRQRVLEARLAQLRSKVEVDAKVCAENLAAQHSRASVLSDMALQDVVARTRSKAPQPLNHSQAMERVLRYQENHLLQQSRDDQVRLPYPERAMLRQTHEAAAVQAATSLLGSRSTRASHPRPTAESPQNLNIG